MLAHPDQSVREGPLRRVSRAESCLAGSASPNLEGCMEGDTFPLAAGKWYQFRELECHLGDVGSRQHSACYAPEKLLFDYVYVPVNSCAKRGLL